MQSTAESRVYKCILCVVTSEKEVSLVGLVRANVKVKDAEFANDAKGRLLVLVQLEGKMRRSEIMRKLESCDEVLKGAEVLVSSGETKAEYTELFGAYFTDKMAAESARKRQRDEASEDEEEKKGPARNSNGVEAVATKPVNPPALSALREEADRLRKENENLAVKNADLQDRLQADKAKLDAKQSSLDALVAKESAFDALTTAYASWRYDTRCKDERIAELQKENARLERALADMTARKDRLQKKLGPR